METTQHFQKGHIPWNKGKLVGQKQPLKLPEVWAIRTRLQLAGKTRDLALFNLAINGAAQVSMYRRVRGVVVRPE
jgi:hypothetical protein